MSLNISIDQLPTELQEDDAIEECFRDEINNIESKLRRGMSALIECDKEVVNYLAAILRRNLRVTSEGGSMRLRMVTGAPESNQSPELQPSSSLQLMLRSLANFVRTSEPGSIICLPHLDLLSTSSRGTLTDMGKEIINLLYENPEITFLAFKDPSMDIPEAVTRCFPVRESLVGVPRKSLAKIITKREARKFCVDEFNPFQLYKYLSGVNPCRFRQIMESIQNRLDYDGKSKKTIKKLYQDIRKLTVSGGVEIPNVDLDKDIGGYDHVKKKIKEEILDLYRRKEELTSPEEVRQMEELIPKGVIFEGPPGTGKSFFCKAMATILDATVHIISGPELKSKWVGESEANLRRVFENARKNAPSIIIFDEIDSFATNRGLHSGGSGVEHSMVNQLLTEMDGFRKEDLVFVVATTNFAESLDTALLRPGRFELTINIPYPNEKDRKAIIEIYNNKFNLKLSEELIDNIVSRTNGFSNVQHGTKFSGDHLYAICRGLSRQKLRTGKDVTTEDIEKIMNQGSNLRPPTVEEQDIIAVHECGHALAALFSKNAPPPEKISIQALGDGIPGYMQQGNFDGDLVRTKKDYMDMLTVLLGGRAAEITYRDSITSGALADLQQANTISRNMVEKMGMGTTLIVTSKGQDFSTSTRERIDSEINGLLREAEKKALKLMDEHRDFHKALLKALLEKKMLNTPDIIEVCKELNAPDYVIKKLEKTGVVEEENSTTTES